MKVNQNISLLGQKVVLVPYRYVSCYCTRGLNWLPFKARSHGADRRHVQGGTCASQRPAFFVPHQASSLEQ